MQDVGKIFLIAGFVLILIGFLFLIDKQSFFGKLPGDIVIERGNFSFYFPLTTSILLSLLLSLIFVFISFLRGK